MCQHSRNEEMGRGRLIFTTCTPTVRAIFGILFKSLPKNLQFAKISSYANVFTLV